MVHNPHIATLYSRIDALELSLAYAVARAEALQEDKERTAEGHEFRPDYEED